ncbi:MAG: FAD-binding oxidoreductase, partial [Sciscionella sp.]
MSTSTDPASMSTADLAAELRCAGVSEVADSTLIRAEYSSDASLYRVPPRVVVTPRDADEVAAALAVCRAEGVPVTARGAGTSIAGNAVGPGVVLDFSRHLNRVLSIDPERREAVVQPGVVLDALQREARPHALRFGPDPSTHNRCTLGGMIGNNACGSRALGYGRTADNVLGLDVLTGSGERLHAIAGADPASSPTLTALHRVVAGNLGVIRTELGRFSRQVSGYSLEHLLPENGFDVAKALVGTEGTCGIVLGATLRLVPAPATSMLVVLGYPDMASAADAVPTLLPHRPTALEGLDARIVDAVRTRRGASRVPVLPDGSGWLFVELSGDTTAELYETARRLVADTEAKDSLVVDDPAKAAALWRIREDGAGLSARSERGAPAHAGWEDAAVPPERLGDYLREFDALLTRHGLAGIPYGHFGDGCLHIRIDFPLSADDGRRVFRDFMLDAAKLVAAHGGSCSGEHGDGRTRGELLGLMYSADAIAAFGGMKAAFDPDDLLNPGIIVRPLP